jgi:hypothetical protein
MSNNHHHRGVFDTWTKRSRPQIEWAQGLIDWPNSLVDRPGFEAVRPEPWLPHVYTRRQSPESVEKVGGGRSTWSADHMAWLAGHHLAPNRPLQVGGGLIQPYKYPPPAIMVNVDTSHSFCSSPLVKVPV